MTPPLDSLPNVGLLCAALLSIAACGAVPAAAQDSLTVAYPADACRSCAEWNASQAPFQIHGDTYYVGTRGLAAVLVTSPGGHVLIDGGLPDSAPLILENIATLGFDIADVEVILNTHAHFDHAGGIAALQEASGARVVATPESAAAMRQGSGIEGDPQRDHLLEFPVVATVEEIGHGETLEVGPLALTAHVTPVHSPGGTSWTWESCEGGLCVGMVFADSQSVISAEGFRFTDSPALGEYEQGFARLEQLPCHILITPHPGASSFWERLEGSSGLMDPTACARYAHTARASLAERIGREASDMPAEP